MNIKKGDLVLKLGDFEKGKKGIVLLVKENDLGNAFISVLLSDGSQSIWYANVVKVVHAI